MSNAIYRYHRCQPVGGWVMLRQSRTPASPIWDINDKEWFDHIAETHGFGFVKCGVEMWSIDPVKDDC